AIDASGNFVVAWKSRNQVSGTSGFDIYMRRFDAAGSALSGETLVNTTTVQDQKDPAIAMNASGQFVISWFGGPFLGEDVFARAYANTGSPVTGEIAVNTTTGD